MGLALTAVELTRVEALQRALLAPLDFDDVDDWRRNALAHACTLLDGEGTAWLNLDAPGAVPFYAEGVSDRAVADYAAHYAHVDRAPEGLAAGTRSVVVQAELFAHPDAGAYFAGEAWNDFYVPNGISNAAAAHTLAEPEGTVPFTGLYPGTAIVGVFGVFRTPGQPLFAEHEAMLMALVQPAFAAGVRTYRRLSSIRAALFATLDAAGQPTLAVDAGGAVLHPSAALGLLLAGDSERTRVVEAMRHLGAELARAATPGRRADKAHSRPLVEVHPERRVTTATAPYRLTATLLPPGVLGHPLALVTAARITPAPPSMGALMARFALSPQEARVALLLAERRVNAEVADALRISPHTARRYTERVLEKLEVHRRRDVAGVLAGASRPS